ncbi:hypothetical protein DL95DRAFT_419169 [Leptodontidium sp. 2 PMI_412]|nr:hypothetical protein DL95DRAFT_419169 [Leptodontidium sp. 2 PMI_412]
MAIRGTTVAAADSITGTTGIATVVVRTFVGLPRGITTIPIIPFVRQIARDIAADVTQSIIYTAYSHLRTYLWYILNLAIRTVIVPLGMLPWPGIEDCEHEFFNNLELDSTLDVMFTDIIDTTVRYSFGSGSSEPGQKADKVAFHVSWQLQECIRQEFDGDIDLAPVLTVTGKENAWATNSLEYVRTTWGELGNNSSWNSRYFLARRSTEQVVVTGKG